ncbi:hypothetical protein [Streptomyces sp. bgisy126]|uniref:hypothetical protein n=1 Tax=unclassified Streptomyces TaxID=2593676 RepID=UPI003EBE30D1
MRRSREQTRLQDLPGELWHALARLHHTHPDPVGRVGPLARPAGLLSFTAAADTILTARVQLNNAETMHQVNQTLRAMTDDLPHAHFTGPDVALELTLSRRQDLPLHEAHIAGLTRLLRHAAGTIGAQHPGRRPLLPLRRDRTCPTAMGAGCRARVSGTQEEGPRPGPPFRTGRGTGGRKDPGGLRRYGRRLRAQRRERRAPALGHRAQLLPIDAPILVLHDQ